MTTPANPPADLVTWLRAQLDDRERGIKEDMERSELGHAEHQLLRAVQDSIDSDRQCVDALESAIEAKAPDVSTLTWIVKDRARKYAGRPGFREEWKPT